MRRLFLSCMFGMVQAQTPWSYVSYLGGRGDEWIEHVRSDPEGNTFVAGRTSTLGRPFGNQEPNYTSTYRGFIAKFSPLGSLVYKLSLNGSSSSFSAIEVDAEGNAYLAGTVVASEDFATPGAYQTTGSNALGFVAEYGRVLPRRLVRSNGLPD
jgi:hypothetical protein